MYRGGVFFFIDVCCIFYDMFVSIWRKVLRNKHHQFIPLWKKYFVWAPSSSVSAIWQFLPAAGASGNSDHLLKNVPWLCKGKYSTLASSALARLSSRHLLAHVPGSLLCGIMSRVGLCIPTDISSAPLEGHSGSIQAALNLEFADEKVNFFEIAIEGINGQLPNLDLVNTVFRLCRKERIQAALHTEVNSFTWINTFKV